MTFDTASISSAYQPVLFPSMSQQVYAIDVDITETMGDLLARAGEALSLDLTHHRVTVLGERQVTTTLWCTDFI